MDHPIERCAGFDVHKDSIVVCIRVAEGIKPRREVRTFRTVTGELLKLRDWLEQEKVTHVAMESTSVYWRPVWHILEGGFQRILANARDVKNLPGRKTDVKDAEWIAELLSKGLLPQSFVPPEPIQDLRDLTRTRKQLGREICQHVQRVQKVLEEANIKLASFLSDIMGQSGRRVLDAIASGTDAPEQLANLISKRVKAKQRELLESLQGRVREHHRFLLQLHLRQIDAVEALITDIERRIDTVVEPFRHILGRLITTPGIGRLVAEVVLAECGADMTPFPTVSHFVSWAGLTPRNARSAGKSKSVAIREGNTWLKPILVQAAWAAVRTKNTYLNAQFRRLKARRGPKKAIIAVAASILTAVYFIIRDGADYKELGGDYFQHLDSAYLVRKHIAGLKQLGYDVTIAPKNSGAA